MNPKLAEIYDLDSPWSVDRDFYLSLTETPSLENQPKKILDLGCGTGLLCDAYAARGHDVTGVDPSLAMLEVARRKPFGQSIEWIHSTVQNYQSDKVFDLIVMTGHAFQVLLEEDDVIAAFAVMRQHMNSQSLLVFESLNPQIDWANDWNYEMNIELRNGSTVRESRRFIAMNNGRMNFELRYDFPDETLISASELRFFSRSEIEHALSRCGLAVDSLLGDWDRKPFDESSSPEMIFMVRTDTWEPVRP